MESKLRVYVTEWIGTYCLVVLVGGVVCATGLPAEYHWPRIDMWAVALANGCALAVLLTLSAGISEGCLNPVITLVLWVCRRLDTWQAAGLIVVQLLASVLAGLTLRYVFPERALVQARMGAPHLESALLPADDVFSWTSMFKGIGVEGFLTFVLTLVIFYFVIDRRAVRLGGLFAGMAQAVITLAGYKLTGGAANPALWFGPALWELSLQPLKSAAPFEYNPVYWAGPIVGGLLGGLLYTSIISPGPRPAEAGT